MEYITEEFYSFIAKHGKVEVFPLCCKLSFYGTGLADAPRGWFICGKSAYKGTGCFSLYCWQSLALSYSLSFFFFTKVNHTIPTIFPSECNFLEIRSLSGLSIAFTIWKGGKTESRNLQRRPQFASSVTVLKSLPCDCQNAPAASPAAGNLVILP